MRASIRHKPQADELKFQRFCRSSLSDEFHLDLGNQHLNRQRPTCFSNLMVNGEKPMNIEALSGGQSLFQTLGAGGAGRQAPPSGDEIAAKVNDAIKSGSVDGSEIQFRLSERFGEDADGILQEDGSLDPEKLSSLLEANRPEGPPPGAQQFAGTDESELVQTLFDSLEESDENTDAAPSLVEQLYGQASGGKSTNEELFSIFA